MHKKNIIAVVITVVGIIGYIAFLGTNKLMNKQGEAPVLDIPESVLTLSVYDGEDKLLNGISATDSEDGDLSGEVFVEKISDLDANMERVVSYAVIDSDDMICQGTRRIKYSDYQLPKIVLKKAMVGMGNFVHQTYSYLEAKSVVDGDISDSIFVKDGVYLENESIYTIQVTDSFGGTSSIDLRYTFVDEEMTLPIELSDVMIYVDKGTEIDPMDYVVSVFGGDEAYENIKVTSDYDGNTEGIYQIFYEVKLEDGYGLNKLVVVVE